MSLEEHLSSLTRYLSKTREKSRADILIDMKAWEIQHRKLLEQKISQIQALKTRYNKHLEAKSTRQSGFIITMWMLSEKDFERFTEEVLALLVSPSTPTFGGKKE